MRLKEIGGRSVCELGDKIFWGGMSESIDFWLGPRYFKQNLLTSTMDFPWPGQPQLHIFSSRLRRGISLIAQPHIYPAAFLINSYRVVSQASPIRMEAQAQDGQPRDEHESARLR